MAHRELSASALVVIVCLVVVTGAIAWSAWRTVPPPVPVQSTARDPWPTDLPRVDPPTLDTGPLVVVVATNTPMTPTRLPNPTNTVAACGSGTLGICQWAESPAPPTTPEPAPTAPPLPVCITPIPGERCIEVDQALWPAVPDVRYQPRAAAEATLTASGFGVAIYCAKMPGTPEVVIGQDPLPGTPRPAGWPVEIAIVSPCETA